MTDEVHPRAARGFDRAGAEYERGRPGYPVAAVARLAAELELAPGARVLDLAAGTGKLTRRLLDTGAEVIAVEPLAGMRAQLERRTPGIDVRDGTAEHIPLGDAAVQAVTVAQAFHWFDAGPAAAEIRRVLIPGGRLAVIWNAWDETVPWVARVQGIVHEHVGDAPQQRTSRWQHEVAAGGRFGTLHEQTFAHTVLGDAETLAAHVASTSYISALPGAERAQVLASVAAVIAADPLTAGRPEFEMPYTTHLVWAQRA